LLPAFLRYCEFQGLPLTGDGLLRLAAPAVASVRAAFAQAIKDHKPVFIDLESYLSLDLFASWVRRHGAIQVTEMLPIPEESWWREPEGVYCYEIRALVAPGASGSHRGIRGVRPDPPARA
jgi:hypothetical protein